MAAHIPVLAQEVLTAFSPVSGNVLLDATLGLGGHAEAYLEAISGSGHVIGFDADARALEVARERLKKYGERVEYVNANFSHLNDAFKWGGMVEQGESSFKKMSPDHILFDLGLGSHQLRDLTRAFSFSSPGSLTMAYGELTNLPPSELSALRALEEHLGYAPDVPDILSGISVSDLAKLVTLYGEERYAQRIAQALKKHLPIVSGQQLAHVVADAVPAGYEHGRIHPATRTFQALRLAVNRELEALAAALPQAVEIVKPGGVIAVISFHSLEDRIVKQFFRSRKGELEILTKKPVQASEAEIRQNPRARSAKLRAARKT